ncbi:MAG TPA: EamA family transporter, partial [Puia sp.]|nr:EamA family transporter [Puia sp.]
LVAISILWGLTWIVSRQGVHYMPALQLAGIRQTFAGIVFLSYFLFKKSEWPRGKQWLQIFVLSLLNLVLTNGLTTLSVKYISAGLASIIAAIYPLWLVIIAAFSLRSTVSFKTVLGLILGFAGICLVFYGHLKDFFNPDFQIGILISIAASVSWAFGTLYTKKLSSSFNPYFSIAIQMVIAGIFLYAFSTFSGQHIPVRTIPWQSWTAIFFLAIFGSITAFIAFLYAIQHLPVAQVSIYAYINPIVAVLAGSWFLQEELTYSIALGGIITLYGVYLVNKTVASRNSKVPSAE